MRLGLDKNGEKIRPIETGDRAVCEMCGSNLIAHCGDIRRKHWQHESKKDCDSWKGEETEWHLNWKSNFPKNCQEVVIKKDGEKHRADVKTENNLVIEFQNSSISYSDIEIREKFYGKMIWVINAEEFNSHLITNSIVKYHLQRVKGNARYEFSELKNNYNKKIEEVENKITENQNICKMKIEEIKENKKKIEKFNNQLSNIDSFAKEIIDIWSVGDFLFSDRFEIKYEIDGKYRTDLENLSKAIEIEKGKLNSLKHQLNVIEKLEDYKIDDKIFKIVIYSQISSENFSKVKVIEKNSDFFSENKSINSLEELKSYSYKKDNFIFVIDPSDKIADLNQQILQTKTQLNVSNESLRSLQYEVKNAIQKSLKNKIDTLKKENRELENEWEKAIHAKTNLESKKAILIHNKDAWLSEIKSEIDQVNSGKRSQIMNSKKGLYSFDWKHERKSWTAAKCPIYFDLGNGFLLKKLNDRLVKKISIEKFLSMYQNRKINQN